MGGTSIEEKTPLKRRYVKSGKYAKKNYSYKIKKVTLSNLKSVNWKALLTSVLKQRGKPMTSKELVKAMFIGKHKPTLRVLKHRMSVALAFYKNNGILKTDRGGRGLKYGLPSMF